MNAIFFHMAGYKKNHQEKMTKTLETNITSDKGEEKSKSNSQTQVATNNQNSNYPNRKQNNLYLLQYIKYFNKKLVIKYNILPNEYTLMKLDNFITAKYCHSLASFKENLIFNYDEEFLNRFYLKKESLKKIPLFSEFYKSYLQFFCFPTLAELKLNDLIEDMVEKKAKAFYNENFSEKKEKNLEKKINVVIFTNKIRQDISRRNSLTNLTKTTIKNHSITNRSSVSLATIEKIFNELNYNKKIKINNNNKHALKKNNSNSINRGLKNSVILHKIKKKIKNNKKKETNNISSKIKCNTNTNSDRASSSKRKKIKNKISRNIQNKLLENKSSTLNIQKLGIGIIQKNSNVHSIFKINSKNNNLNKNIIMGLDTQRISSNSENNSKNVLSEKNRIKQIRNKPLCNNNNSNACKNNYTNTYGGNLNIKNNTLLTNHNSNVHSSRLKINNNINNINIYENNNLNSISNINHFNLIINNAISNSDNNSNRNIKKKTIKVIKKPSMQKIKQIRQIKSRNYKSGINETNSIYSTKNNLIYQSSSRDNISDYYTINNKNINTISIKLNSNKKLKPKIKLVKAEDKINSNKHTNLSQNNAKVFNFITARKKNTNYLITSKTKNNNAFSSSSLKTLNEKNQGINNTRKNRVIDSKNNTQVNTNSYVLYDSQNIIKNLKIVNSRDNSRTLLNDYKIKIKKMSESPINNEIKNLNIKNYYKK